MSYATNIHFSCTDENKSEKVIQFSSSFLTGFTNIPNKVVLVIFFPFMFLIVLPVVNILLYRLIRKVKKQAKVLENKAHFLSYDNAQQAYDSVSKLVDITSKTKNDIAESAASVLTRSLYRKFSKINQLLIQIQNTLSACLYIKTEQSEPLTEEEQKAYQEFNEIWGDDNDKVYAKHTHRFLTQKLKCNGI